MLTRLARLVAVAFVAWVGFGLVLVVAIFVLKPGDPSDERQVRFLVEVAMPDGPRPRTAPPWELRLAREDATALGLSDGRVSGRWGTFAIHTDLTASGDDPYQHCLAGPAEVIDLVTGAARHRIPAGTCLLEREPLALP